MISNISRVCLLAVAGSAICSSLAAAEVFNCDRAAQFGYSDLLCEKPEKGIPSIPSIADYPKADASAEGTAPNDRYAGSDNSAMQAAVQRQNERANQRAWENYRSWNRFGPIFPPAFFSAGGEWSPLKLPSLALPAPSEPSRQASKPKLFGP